MLFRNYQFNVFLSSNLDESCVINSAAQCRLLHHLTKTQTFGMIHLLFVAQDNNKSQIKINHNNIVKQPQLIILCKKFVSLQYFLLLSCSVEIKKIIKLN